MSPIASGPLPALIQYYERLNRDENQTVAEFGFSREKIHFQVVLDRDGTIVSLDDIRPTNERGKRIANLMLVPDGGGRSGTGLKPCFCWDNTGYALGRDNKGNTARAAAMFASFRELHLSLRGRLREDEAYDTLCRFLESWNPNKCESLLGWTEAAGQNVVFKLRGREGFVHQSAAVQNVWKERLRAESDDGEGVDGVSLLSGREETLARLHPLISGVAGTNTTGAAIVSFNLDAFTSYGKSQSYNAPVGVHDAFRYTTALNRLVADDQRRVRIGDATVVFWTDRAEAKDAEDMLAAIFGERWGADEAAESSRMVDRLRGFLQAAREGKLSDHLSDPEAPFYILGLSPNASRINVRFWLAGKVTDFVTRLAQHAADLEIVGAPRDAPPPAIRSLLLETARDPKDIAPQLAGEMSRAVLQGLAYPTTLLNSVVQRIRADGAVSWRRAAILKAFLKREGNPMEVYLNKAHKVKAYHCGRLLAVLAFAQEHALGTINSGVIRRNIGAVMATPGLMLGRLQRLAEQGHIPKLEGDLPAFVRDELKTINVMLRDDVPVQLDLRQQAVFALGFYQELQYLDFIGSQIKSPNKKLRPVRTTEGEWVRSRLEARVAEALTRARIRYVYEVKSMLPTGQERWPDFFLEGPSKDQDVYLEVLGMSGEEYERTWQAKVAAYAQIGITPVGGPGGYLVILDWRNSWGPEPEKTPCYPSDRDVLNVLRPVLPIALAASENNTNNGETANV